MAEKTIERRLTIEAFKIAERANADGTKTRVLTGYAAKFNSMSCDLGGFKERIIPGAFRSSLSSGCDVRALCDHDPAKILARTSEGTLRLREDDQGLAIEADLPDTSYARDLDANVVHKNVRGMSFGFCVPPDGERWTRDAATDYAIRELTNIDLREVTATSIPAYEATELYVRVAPECANRAAQMHVKPALSQRQATLRRMLCE